MPLGVPAGCVSRGLGGNRLTYRRIQIVRPPLLRLKAVCRRNAAVDRPQVIVEQANVAAGDLERRGTVPEDALQ